MWRDSRGNLLDAKDIQLKKKKEQAGGSEMSLEGYLKQLFQFLPTLPSASRGPTRSTRTGKETRRSWKHMQIWERLGQRPCLMDHDQQKREIYTGRGQQQRLFDTLSSSLIETKGK